MKAKVLILTILALAIGCDELYSQAFPGLSIPNVDVHSPDVTALGKYGEYLVDPSTGVVPVNIPLYTIKTPKLEFPISLSYHASGIKVEEEASYVGLGWTLNASGVITRQVKDKADDGPNGFLTHAGSLPDYNPISNDIGAGYGTTSYADTIDGWYNNEDKEPDLFNIISPNLTAEFSCDNTGKFVSTIFDSLKYDIQLYNNILIVTDRQGIAYRFGKSFDYVSAYETTSSSTQTTSLLHNSATETWPLSNATSWFLTAIISADKSDTISFSYKVGAHGSYRVVSQTQNIKIDDADNMSDNDFHSTYLSETCTNLQIIDKITFKNGYIQFYNATDRQDVYPMAIDGELNNVRITGFAVFDNQSNLLRKVVLDNNDYFARSGGYSVNDVLFGDAFFKKSLKLDGVKFYDKDSAFIYDYKFQYDNTALPPRGSTALDYWGYSNGKLNNNLIPAQWIRNYWTGQPTTIGGDRSTDINYMKAASLTQVTYPTGGYTKFNYEPNYYLTSAQEEGEIEEPRSENLQALQSTGRTDGCILPIHWRTVPASDTLEFTVSEAVENSIAVAAVHFSDFEYWNNSEMTAKITDLTNGNVYSFEQTTATMTQNKDINQTINFYQGHTYRMEVNTNAVTGSVNGFCNSPYVEFDLSYTVLVHTSSTNITPTQAGGLRIKSITNYNTDNSPISEKVYTYGDTAYGPDHTGIGSLITDPSSNDYYFPILLGIDGSPCSQELFKFIWYTSNSLIDLGLNNGNAVVYSKVTEQTVSTADTTLSTGKTEYYYNYPKYFRSWLPQSKYPYQGYIYPDWGHNNLVKKVDYKSEGGTYSPVHKIEYNYQDLPENRIKTLHIEEMEPSLYASWCDVHDGIAGYLSNSQRRFFFYNYFVSCGRIMKVRETETYYSNNDSLVSSRTYSYNGYLDLSKLQTTDSKQHQIQTSYKYTGDLNYSGLVASNMVSLPVQQENLINGQVRNGSILTYDSLGQVDKRYVFNQNSSVAPISYTDYSSIPSTYEKRESLTYDLSHNNLQEVDRVNSYNISYLWGYHGQYPIAEVKNARAADIAYTSFEADANGGWTIGSTDRDSVSPAITGHNCYLLGKGISKAGLNASNTYIVSYWAKSNSAMQIAGTLSGFPVKGKTVSLNGVNWTFYMHKVTGQSTVVISGSGWIDEVRLYPATAQMTSYTYDPLVGMTSQADAGSRITYFEYDAFQRLKRIRDQDYNILKSYEYQYQATSGCGSGCYSIAMQTFAGSGTLSYPVGVFNVRGVLLGNASTPAQYLSLWNSDTANTHIGTLALGSDSMHFNITLAAGATMPSGVTGCRYYQVDLAYTLLDGMFNTNGAYVDFGDGEKMRLGSSPADTPKVITPHTSIYNYGGGVIYINHSYPTTSLKTITIYHNDGQEQYTFDNLNNPATSLSKLQNIRGNVPQHTLTVGGSSYQQASMQTTVNIANWNSIQSITSFFPNTGDQGTTPCMNLTYPQDFMANNKGLQTIFTTYDTYKACYRDSTFKISRLKSDWNTYFTQLQTLQICDEHWNREDITALINLTKVAVVAPTKKFSNDPTNNPITPLPSNVVDNILMQVAAGSGKYNSNGTIILNDAGTVRTSASDSAVAFLKSKGWTIYLGGSIL